MRYEHTLACDLDQVLRFIGPALICDGHKARLARFASGLPSMDGGFECTLGGDGPPADVSFRFGAQETVGQVVAGRHPFVRLPAALASHPVWRRAGRALEDLPPDAHVWLEYDDATLDDEVPAPSLIVKFWSRDRTGPLADTAASLQALSGDAADPASLDLASRLVTDLPGDAFVEEIGVMAARPGAPLRLRVAALHPVDLRAMLARAGWPVHEEQSGALLALGALDDTLTASIDIAGGHLVKLGVPVPCREWPTAPLHIPRTIACLSWLLAQGACTPAEAVACRDWFGWNHDSRDPADFPHQLTPEESRERVIVHRRGLSQFKIGFGRGGGLTAKVYFGFYRCPILRDGAAALPISGAERGLAA